MSNMRFRAGSSPTSGPVFQSSETLIRDEVMKAQEELGRILRAEFQLDLQTNREKQLCDIDAIRAEKRALNEKINAKTKQEIRDIRVSH